MWKNKSQEDFIMVFIIGFITILCLYFAYVLYRLSKPFKTGSNNKRKKYWTKEEFYKLNKKYLNEVSKGEPKGRSISIVFYQCLNRHFEDMFNEFKQLTFEQVFYLLEEIQKRYKRINGETGTVIYIEGFLDYYKSLKKSEKERLNKKDSRSSLVNEKILLKSLLEKIKILEKEYLNSWNENTLLSELDETLLKLRIAEMVCNFFLRDGFSEISINRFIENCIRHENVENELLGKPLNTKGDFYKSIIV